MTTKPDPEDIKERNTNMDRYDAAMNQFGHYSHKGLKKFVTNLNGKCLDGTPSKAHRHCGKENP